MRDERLYLHDILTACDAIAAFLKGQDSESFYANDQLEASVAYKLTIMGEAVSHLSDDLKLRHAEIPWKDIVGFRNQAVHHYFGLFWNEVWETASNEVPVLRDQIAEILRSEFPNS
jgi:uncharacterized protein with HEPN domain